MDPPQRPRKSLIPSAYRGEAPADPLGSTVGGYVLERLLGKGGMGAAYLGRRRGGGPPVVVKLLAPEVADQAQVVLRFQREGDALRKLPAHPHLVRVLEVLTGSQPGIVMEYVAGTSLFQLVREAGRLPPTEAIALTRQVALAMAVAHAHGLIHRDLNPNNILRTPEGGAKVIDFGIARDEQRSTLTQDGQMLGTIHYMAPELLEGGARPSPATDVFSLGASLYLLVTGQLPFRASRLEEVAGLILSGDFPAPRAVAPHLSEDLERLLLQALEPDPSCRYASMEEVADDLARLLAGEPCSVVALVDASGRRVPLLPGRRFTLGSGPGCQVAIQQPSVAPQHAQVRRQASGWVLCDLRSASGTSLNGAPVTRPAQLADGDRLRLGQVELLFVDPRGRASRSARG